MFGLGKGKKAAKVTPVTLQEQIDALEGQFRSLKLEWTDTYERLYKIAGRLDAAKRWAPANNPTLPTGDKEIVPDNGSEAPIPTPEEPAAAPVARMSRAELMRSLTG